MTHLGGLPEFVRSRSALASAFAKGFKRNVEPDFVSISEAIRHCFCRGEDADTDAIDAVFLNSVGEHFL
jgi:hypothetical protein